MQWGSFIWRRQYPGWYCKFESFHFQVVDKASQKAPLWKILINQAWQKFIKVDKSWRFRIILQNKPHTTRRKRRWLKSRDMERWQIVPWSHLYQMYEFITNFSTYLLTYSLTEAFLSSIQQVHMIIHMFLRHNFYDANCSEISYLHDYF